VVKVPIYTNETHKQWAQGQFGEWSPGGSTGPLPLPSEVNGPVEMPTAEDYAGYAADTKAAYLAGKWQTPKRYNNTFCGTCGTQLPLTNQCDFC
jgi:hypothetical protein